MVAHSIDLNADLGEHPGEMVDEMIMPYLSSCNIACGGHIGDEASVRHTVRLALANEVAIGAHPSYPDPVNFGRKAMLIQPEELAKSIKEQIVLVQRICDEEGAHMHHVKPHGALYNRSATDRFLAELMYQVMKEVAAESHWMGLAESEAHRVARMNQFAFIAEGFADRQYESDGTLRSRSKNGAVLSQKEVLAQVDALVFHQRAKAHDWIPMQVQSICLHGDTEGAVTLAKQINHHLVSQGVQISPVS